MIATPILKEITSRLRFMQDVGLDYLSLSRAATTLSGGEAQRIRLATQIGSQLMGCLYILDEPSIGLHQRDNDRLIKTLEGLRNLAYEMHRQGRDEDAAALLERTLPLRPNDPELRAEARQYRDLAKGTGK